MRLGSFLQTNDKYTVDIFRNFGAFLPNFSFITALRKLNRLLLHEHCKKYKFLLFD